MRRSRDDGGAGDEAYERDDEDGRLAGLGGGRADERLRLEVRGERGVRVHDGAVECALGWACWKTYLGRPETEKARRFAMTELGNGLCSAKQYEDALLVDEARLSLLQRIGASENSMLVAQSNLANTYAALGRHKEAYIIRRDNYARRLKLYGEEHEDILGTANNYAASLLKSECFVETESLMRTTIPVARRRLGESGEITLMVRLNYARALYYRGDGATLKDLREAVNTLEDTERIARRVLGKVHPTVVMIETSLRNARASLRAREPPSSERASRALRLIHIYHVIQGGGGDKRS